MTSDVLGEPGPLLICQYLGPECGHLLENKQKHDTFDASRIVPYYFVYTCFFAQGCKSTPTFMSPSSYKQ